MPFCGPHPLEAAGGGVGATRVLFSERAAKLGAVLSSGRRRLVKAGLRPPLRGFGLDKAPPARSVGHHGVCRVVCLGGGGLLQVWGRWPQRGLGAVGCVEGVILVATPAPTQDFSPQAGRPTGMAMRAMGL